MVENAMAYLITRTINSSFEVTDVGADYPSVDIAYKFAVESGLAMATDEVKAGKHVGIVEVSVEDTNGRVVARGVVSVASSTLCLDQQQ